MKNLLAVACMLPAVVHAGDIINVEAPLLQPALVEENRDSTTYRVGKEGLALYGGAASVNPYNAVSELPSVSLDAMDPYGMANVPGGNKGLRIRGEMMPHGSIGTVEGIPLTGINPGPGYQWLFDMENFSGISLSEGPISPDRLSFFTNTGVLDSSLLWPLRKRRAMISQSFGSFDFRKTYVRLDSGQLSDGTMLFLSASDTRANKWRGPGNSPDGRSNFEAAIVKPVSGRFDVRLYAAYNDMKEYSYRPLNYAQASSLAAYNSFDYASTSSASAASAINYYGYNRQAFRDWSLLSEFEYRQNDSTSFVLKPFYTKEHGYYLDGMMATSKVRQWLVDHDWYGLTAEMKTTISDTGLKFGYWWESMDPPVPPTAWKIYNPAASGGLNFATWSLLEKTTSRHEFQSLYAMADREFGKLRIRGGARYMTEKLPGIAVYNSTGIGDVSYDQAIASSSGIIASRSVSGPTFGEWLPYLALGYSLTEGAELKLSAGRNYGAPGYDVWPVYQTTAALQAKYTAQQIWDSLKPEIADAVDLGVHLAYPNGYLEPTLFYSKSRNKDVSFVDPAINVAYPQNAGQTHAYGIQMAGLWKARRDTEVFGSLSYDRAVFDGNFTTLGGASLPVQGLQLPDTPQWIASLGAAYRKGAYSISPVMHYTGKRYGDALQKEPVSGYSTVDLDFGYKARLPFGNLDASLSLINLFDRQYIGFINASYLQNSGQTSYYPGAPRTIAFRLSLDM